MAKMKHFGKALAVVRKATRDSAGKMKNKRLAGSCSKMLGAVRERKFHIADKIALEIVKEHG